LTPGTPAVAEPAADGTTARPPSRVGQRAVTTYVSPEAHKQLRMLSIETGESVQVLMTDAMNGLFRKHGKAYIA